MTIHNVKIEPFYFNFVLNNTKTFEIRKNDRDYKIGDILSLWEYDNGNFTGRHIERSITFILNDIRFVKENYVVMSIKEF